MDEVNEKAAIKISFQPGMAKSISSIKGVKSRFGFEYRMSGVA